MRRVPINNKIMDAISKFAIIKTQKRDKYIFYDLKYLNICTNVELSVNSSFSRSRSPNATNSCVE